MDNEDKAPDEYEVKVIKEVEVVEAEPVEAEPVEAEVLEPPQPVEEKKGFFSQFPKLFWVMNTMELFERGAYYGMMAVLHVHVLRNLLFAPEIWGSLYAMLIILLYFMPLISGALALKYGFKKVLLGAFSILILGYFVLSSAQAGQLAILTLGLIFIGIGAGAFKPIISAAIAHVTTEKQRNLGFSIYYWMINLGAFAIPLSLGFIFPEQLRHLYYWVFVISGTLIILNTIIAFFFVTEPVERQKDLSIKQAVLKIVPALKDKKFVYLLAIYSGFWFMYAVNHTFLGPYMVSFKIMPGWFSLPFLAIVNPGTIIATGPFLGKMVEKYKSLNVMMVGMIIYVIGLMIAFFAKVPALFLTGIIIFSLGEFITHPGFIAYVSKISPKDKVTVYMACVFIPTGVGNAVAGVVQGVMWGSIVESSQMPKLFGAIIAAVGALTIGCLILYNRWINRMAKEERPEYKEDRSIWVKLSSSAIAFMFIPVLIGVGFTGGTDIYYGTEETDGGVSLTDWSKYEIMAGNPITMGGYADENTDTLVTGIIKEENLISMNLILTWTDEPDVQYGFRTYENEPDFFSLRVETPNGSEEREGPESNAHGESGEIILTIIFGPDVDPYLNGTGQYNITVECGDCGDLFTTGLIGFTDDGNDWDLTIDYNYYMKPE